MVHIKAAALAVIATVVIPSAAHSWIEQMMVINGQGQFTGNPGYARNATARTAPGFSDPLMVHILPGQGQPAIEQRDINATDTEGITPTDPMCKKTQQQQIQSSGLPRLSAAPGSLVALRYQENGHVTLPQNQPGKPPNRGNVYIYGTTQPKPDDNFLDIFNQWNADGTGGDKRGKLIATQPYDDGYCYQMNSGTISAQRQQQFPHSADQLMGADLWCQNDIKLPADAVSGRPYTLYWVWDWPTEPGVDPSLPKGKAEIYTTCMDIDITAASKRDVIQARAMEPQASGGAAINNAAIPAYMSSLAAPNSAAQASASTPAPVMPSPASTQAPSLSQPAAAAAPSVPSPPGSAPPAAQPTVSNPEPGMNAAAAASIVEAAIGGEISSIFAAGTAAVTITASVPVQTVTVTASPSSQAAASVAAGSSGPPAPNQPAAASPAAASSQPAQASAPSSPPSSMDIQPPVISAIQGTATAVTAVPSATPSSSVVAGASAALPNQLSGTATPAISAASTAAAGATGGACGSSKCRAIKRSRILGRI